MAVAGVNNFGIVPTRIVPCKAAAAITAKVIVSLDTFSTTIGEEDIQRVKLPGATDKAFGITITDAQAAGDVIHVLVEGSAPVLSSAAIATLGSNLAFNTSGKVAIAAPAAGVNAEICGRNRSLATGADKDVNVDFNAFTMQGA